MTLSIKNTEVLRNFQIDLKSFAQKSQNSLDSIQMGLQRTLEWIDERVEHWRSEVEYTEEQVEDAKYNLERCQSNGDDSYIDSSYEEEALGDAEYKLAECSQNLEIAQKWRLELENAVEEFYKRISPFHNLITHQTEKAETFLANKFEKYSAVHLGGSYNYTDSITYSINNEKNGILTESDKIRIVSSVLNFNPNDIKNKASEIRKNLPIEIRDKLTDAEIVAIN
jgi:hypothetical protein